MILFTVHPTQRVAGTLGGTVATDCVPSVMFTPLDDESESSSDSAQMHVSQTQEGGSWKMNLLRGVVRNCNDLR